MTYLKEAVGTSEVDVVDEVAGGPFGSVAVTRGAVGYSRLPGAGLVELCSERDPAAAQIAACEERYRPAPSLTRAAARGLELGDSG
jgi:hypothetical protein